ncbi:ABC transporter ATP-binding protein [Vallitalea guaymasensis]|uniref:ABC transporter ATP-binding protein n=1 Tax=Vallitalea guaymasensis TaxID=1185412 RepID=A0A8J8M8D4_9FIRM|nr:ABC transporter ATP-binding protein [Vallitalea guaymasensis]QUH28070.1 ABC transporter ATP-binding protein [Vallitalea guaymasensis]
MIKLFKRLLNFSGKHRKDIIVSLITSFIKSNFEIMSFMAVIMLINWLLLSVEGKKVIDMTDVFTIFGVMVISIVGKIIFSNISNQKRVISSFKMCQDKRLEIGELMKRVKMGYFNENLLGEITATTTTTLGDIETISVTIFDKVINGLVHGAVISIWILIYDWHIGLITVAGIIIAMIVYVHIQKKSKILSPRRQKAQAGLVTSILEYIQGMGVVKAYNLGGNSSKGVKDAIEESSQANIKLESVFSSLTALYQLAFKIASSIIIVVAPYLLIDGEITIVKCFILLISSFIIYEQMEIVGSVSSLTRVIEASLNRIDNLSNTPIMDGDGKDIKLDNYHIEIKDVSFYYEDMEVIKNMNIKIPENTTTAIVGPSGSGKTTICRLITRFFDVDKGEVTVGGHNVKDFTCESLLNNFSTVFQKVYLFEDTIFNNIRFGKPDATLKEVQEAAKKACCHSFIEALPDGYDTYVGEGGSSLSGGEKQRISIARAILKDAPIIILDEATASVDPENEKNLQIAIRELTKNKTVIMIAHRLSTVKHADQILVINNGQVEQAGKHNELISQEGIYKRFISAREEAIGWQL